MKKDDKKTSVEKTVAPTFLDGPPPEAPLQRFFSGPSTLASPRRSSDGTVRLGTSMSTKAPSPPENTSSSSFKFLGLAPKKAKTLPNASLATRELSDTIETSSSPTMRTKTSKKELPYDYELKESPLQFRSSLLNEESLSPLTLGAAVSEAKQDALSAEEEFKAYLFIFNSSFGDKRTVKKCFADFFNSTIMVDSRISKPVKYYFYKILLKELHSVRAKMLLGNSADKRQLPALAEILRCIKKDMPRSKEDIDVEAYIKAIAANHPAGEFPYADPEQEKLDFVRYALLDNYYFFEYIFTANDTSSENESSTLVRIQRLLYHVFSYQFTLRRNEGIIEKIRSQLPLDDESEEGNKKKIQTSSELKVTNSDLQEKLYQYLETLLKKNKLLSVSGTKTAFLLVYQLSFELIQKGEELNDLFALLMEASSGIGILCAVKDDENEKPMEQWLDLLGGKRSCQLFDTILSTLPALSKNPKQLRALLESTLMAILMDGLDLELLNKLLGLKLPEIDMHICEDTWLMKITKKNGLVEMLRKNIWHDFSLESLANTTEKERAFLSNKQLVTDSWEKMSALRTNNPLLTHAEVSSRVGATLGREISLIKEKWLTAYKTLSSLVLENWRPSDIELSNIGCLRKKWGTIMVDKLAENIPYDYEAYNPQHYTLEILPVEMCANLSDQALLAYKKQINIMKDCYDDILNRIQVRDSQFAQPYFTFDNYTNFIEVIKTISAEKKQNCTEQQIQACAKNLSLWFKEVIAIHHSSEPIFFGVTKHSNDKAENLYLLAKYTQPFIEQLKKTVSKKLFNPLFASSGIVLSEQKTKAAIHEFLRTLIEQKQAESSDNSSSVCSALGSPTTPALQSTSCPASPLSLPSRKL